MAVTSEEEFRIWLQRQPREVCVAIAYRAAMRMLTRATVRAHTDQDFPRDILLTLRMLVTASVGRINKEVFSEDVVMSVAKNGASQAGGLQDEGDVSARYYHLGEAMHPATLAVVLAICRDDRLLEIQQSFLWGHGGSKRWENPASYGFFDALVDLTAYRARDIYADTELDTQTLLAGPISLSAPRAPNPSENVGDRHDILAQGGPWAFWARWYDAAMRGEPLPWDLQRAVALIPDQIWRAGPAAVAEEIARIEDRVYGDAISDAVAQQAIEHLLAQPSTYSDIFAASSQQISVSLRQFQDRADLNGLGYGFTGFEAVAGSFAELSDLLARVETKDFEIQTLKGEIKSLNRVILELRRELRETRSALLATRRLPQEASRLARIGKSAKETILLAGALGSLAGGLFAAMSFSDQWSSDYTGLRDEAHDLATTMENLEAQPPTIVKK